MQFSVLSSGSKANSTFIEVGSQRILIDCGLSGREAGRRLLSLGIDPASLDAILVSHEHSDHINGVGILSRKFKIPVYVNEATSQFLSGIERVEIFENGADFTIANVNVSSFTIVHDAVDPVGFVLNCEGLKFSLATDLGKVTTVVREAISGSNGLVLEANHDLGMLYESDYPWQLKQRISSSHGHLSNDVSGRLLREITHSDLNHVVLGHLSENCNTPEIALSTIKRYLEGAQGEANFSLLCGSMAGPTPLVRVDEEPNKLSAQG